MKLPRILIVEDNPDHLFLAMQALEALAKDYNVESRTSCAEAMEILEQSNSFDLAIIDYSLPDKDGLWLMREIANMNVNMPMIMITGQGDEEIAVGAMKLGAYDYLVKGKDFQHRLPIVVERALSRHALRDELEQSRESILRRNRELATVNALDEAIRKPRDPFEVRKAALRALLREMESDCALFFLRETKTVFSVKDILCLDPGKKGAFEGCRLTTKSPLFQGVEESRASIVRLSLAKDEKTFPFELFSAAKMTDMLSWAIIPVALKQRNTALILLGSSDPAFPMIEDPDVLTTLGNQVAIAHENATMYQESLQVAERLEQKVVERTSDLQRANMRLDRQVERLRFVQELGRRITQELDVEALCSRVCDGARSMLGAGWAGIARYNELKGGLIYEHHYNMPQEFLGRLFHPGEGATGTAWVERRPVYVESYLDYPNKVADVRTSGIALPLVFKDSFLGVLSVGYTNEIHKLDQDDQDLARLLADQVAIAMANTRLVTDLTRKAEELESANEKLRAVDRRKTDFLASMSHELMTPLNSIIGFTAALLRGLSGPLNSEQTKQLSIVKDSAGSLLDLIKDLLDLSKIESGRIDIRRETFDLIPLMDELKEIAERLANDSPVNIRIHLPEFLPRIKTDRTKLRQIMLNLVSNAINYTDEGYIELSCAMTKHLRTDLKEEPAQGNMLRLSVIDTGRGIFDDDLPFIFDEFRRGKNAESMSTKVRGTGLGLAISKKLADALGAKIEVVTKPYQGSNFSLFLPESVICID
ncbi:MAG: GAF domain-containing protein [Deltaproteobacteria bacterium]|nr:GAF domain-containing protein [Deltaproteobacteria bacterium]